MKDYSRQPGGITESEVPSSLRGQEKEQEQRTTFAHATSRKPFAPKSAAFSEVHYVSQVP